MSYDNTKVSRTYQIDKQTARRLAALADQLGAYYSPLADMLLSRALDEVDAGNWTLSQEPVKFVVKWAD